MTDLYAEMTRLTTEPKEKIMNNPHVLTPSIEDAKRLAKANDLRRCVILYETSEGRVGYASYGATKRLCDSTRGIMDFQFKSLEAAIHETSEWLRL